HDGGEVRPEHLVVIARHLLEGQLRYRRRCRVQQTGVGGRDKPAAVAQISKLYEELIEIENTGGIEASEKYLIGYLDAQRKTYDEFIDEVIGNKGAFKLFFSTMAKLFGGK
ncbi:MAG: hypothetical protein P8Y51_08235, partial [Campylobacterales bacterium]